MQLWWAEETKKETKPNLLNGGVHSVELMGTVVFKPQQECKSIIRVVHLTTSALVLWVMWTSCTLLHLHPFWSLNAPLLIYCNCKEKSDRISWQNCLYLWTVPFSKLAMQTCSKLLKNTEPLRNWNFSKTGHVIIFSGLKSKEMATLWCVFKNVNLCVQTLNLWERFGDRLWGEKAFGAAVRSASRPVANRAVREVEQTQR